MNRKNTAPIPEAITQLQQELEQFRTSRPARTKLPESLWQAAAALARQHGIYAVAHPLRLDYVRLKQRLNGVPRQRRKLKPAPPAFVELIGSGAATLPECVIEFESAAGSKMRIHPIDRKLRSRGSIVADRLPRMALRASGIGAGNR